MILTIFLAILSNIAYIKMCEQSKISRGNNHAEKRHESQDADSSADNFSKGGVLTKNTVDLDVIVKDQVSFALRGLRNLPVDVDHGLWPVEVDVGQIGNVIDNLVVNALQAMPGGGNIRIGLKNITGGQGDYYFLRSENYVAMIVTDEGVGIPKKNIDKIFDPYFSTKSSGSGLGLAITYSIIKRHHGDIKVVSEPGVGTTFFVYLPASSNKPETDRSSSG